ncbi:GNAT family N-acetyltransferase [Specibacter sp. RAF43]|uniref:GNAT family N-acetyltransferase n=1 Tax=Specibacter sp. RAF43 TaxID=3233057 RepID=UPI003F94FB3B
MPLPAPEFSAPTQPDYPLRTERLRLRPVRAGDVPAINAYRSRPDVVRYLPHPPQTVADTELTVKSMMSQAALSEPGQWLDLAVEYGDGADPVGEVLLKWDGADPRLGEIGFVFSPAAQGRGIAREACAAALDLAFTGFGWHRVEGICDDRNGRSAALMTRLGMRLEATFVESDWFKGEWVSLRHYAILGREWPEVTLAGTGRR